MKLGYRPVVMPATGRFVWSCGLFSNNTYSVLATSNAITDTGSAAGDLGEPGRGRARRDDSTMLSFRRGRHHADGAAIGSVSTRRRRRTRPTRRSSIRAAAQGRRRPRSGSGSCSLPRCRRRRERTSSACSRTTLLNLLATSGAVTVTAPPPASLSASPGSVAGGGAVSVAWANVAPASSTDWVALYQAGTSGGEYLDWFYDSSCTQTAAAAAPSGSCSYSMPTTPGTYDLVLYANNGNTVLATSRDGYGDGVADHADRDAVDRQPGQPGRGRLNSACPHRPGRTGSASPPPAQPTARTRASSMTRHAPRTRARPRPARAPARFSAPATDGSYEFRLFASNGFTRLATSDTLTVAG